MDATRVFLSLGSNLGDREGNLRAALEQLGGVISIQAVSSLYETDPIGVRDQPAFINLAVGGETLLEPDALLRTIKGIERRVGRTPTFRWGPRVLDIDILLYDDLTLITPDLTIPHHQMRHRAFVLTPLEEIAGEYVDPVSGWSIDQLSQVAGHEGVRRMGRL